MKKFFAAVFLCVFFNAASFSQTVQKKPKVALVLSGGGAKGLAEIPLLEALEAEGIQVDMVLGTSMGALLGALYSSGYSPKEIRQIMTSLDFVSILSEWPVPAKRVPSYAFSTKNDNLFSISFSLTDPKFGSAPSILGDQQIVTLLNSYLSKTGGIEDFDKLPIPYRAITTDVSTGKEVVYKNGSLAKAVRGSMSLPGVWVPALMDDGTYVMDGGLEDNLPVKVAREMGADIVIAMDVASSVYTDPQSLDDLLSVGIQIFNLIISTNAVKQHTLADVLLIPNLENFSTLDFSHPADIVAAGQLCVEQNKEAIHKIAQQLQKAGVELCVQDYDRESIYSKMPERIIEKITVTDISFKEPVPLPSPDEFDEFVGKKLDDKTQEDLVRSLNDFRTRYHLATLSFDVQKGCDSAHCVLDIQANHYNQDLSRVFWGGRPAIFVSNSDAFLLSAHPELTFGIYLSEPIDLIFHAYSGNTKSVDFSILPQFAKWGQSSVHFDAGAEVCIGSLEPHTNIIYKDHSLADDEGFSAHAGLQFRYIDFITASLGAEYNLNYLCQSEDYFHLGYLYFDAVIQTLRNEIISLKGFKLDALFKIGECREANLMFLSQVFYKQNFEILYDRTGVGFEIAGTNVRFPYELNVGYGDFGGINGMCGYPQFTYKRDFAFAGLFVKQRLANIFGWPLMLIAQAKVGVCDDYNPYTNYGVEPAKKFFHGVQNINDVIGGAALYVALKTPPGNIIAGCSFNSRGKYCVLLGFM